MMFLDKVKEGQTIFIKYYGKGLVQDIITKISGNVDRTIYTSKNGVFNYEGNETNKNKYRCPYLIIVDNDSLKQYKAQNIKRKIHTLAEKLKGLQDINWNFCEEEDLEYFEKYLFEIDVNIEKLVLKSKNHERY